MREHSRVVVGVASVVAGICIVALALNQSSLSKAIATSLSGGGHAWGLPVSREVFLLRSKI